MKKNVIDTTHIGVGHMENDTITKQMVSNIYTKKRGKNMGLKVRFYKKSQV